MVSKNVFSLYYPRFGIENILSKTFKVGLGDQLLASGQAKLLHQKTGLKVQIGSPKTGAIWMPLYDDVPYLGDEIWLTDYPGCRGYIKRIERGKYERVIFDHNYRAEPATVVIDPIDTDYIIIEPETKGPPAKKWHYYQQVVDAFPKWKFLQFNQKTLNGVDTIKTTVKQAAAYMKGARAYIGTEGFLHHLAAAVGTPAVVLIGAYSLPEIIGYSNHINLCIDDPDELGHRSKFGAMERIKPEKVIEVLYDCCRD